MTKELLIPDGWHKHENGGGLVQDTARVEKSAYIGTLAQISGNAQISGDAQIYGDAWISGDAWAASPLYVQGSSYSLTNCKYGYIQIGCQSLTYAEWREQGEGLAKRNGLTPEQIEEYRAYLDLFEKIGKRFSVNEEPEAMT